MDIEEILYIQGCGMRDRILGLTPAENPVLQQRLRTPEHRSDLVSAWEFGWAIEDAIRRTRLPITELSLVGAC
ncbi:hypothetical protein HB780_01385 (plasmid) [Rhizobium lusitanum]|uniref:hypothetical protein n=1 Tax=Rhizobium lusitanum TaxID=293958 RepID=UPI001610336D|nr:hypothetical protein [Rhizobium lusitanum]QND44478.1 hypothetical protein HB780_01385 [Rhizobium lusitanum]